VATTWLSTLSILVGIAGTLFALRAAMTVVRDNQDEFIGDIKRQSRWATYAALAGCISAGLNAVLFSFWLAG
jgi:hypothetical protein